MADFGVDYSYSRPEPAAMAHDGVRFACRYLRGGGLKALTAAEASRLAANGISIVSNDETTGTQLLGGFAGGRTDAQRALEAHHGCGGPDGRPIYFSPWDHDPAGLDDAQWTLLWRYLDGAAAVLGPQRVGLYGGYLMIQRAFDGGHITWGWQTYAWSHGQWDSRAHLQQYQNGVNRWGGTVDYDRATKADYGAWRPGQAPPPALEVDMPLTEADFDRIRKEARQDLFALYDMVYNGRESATFKEIIAARASTGTTVANNVSLAALDDRLAAIEALLAAPTPPPTP